MNTSHFHSAQHFLRNSQRNSLHAAQRNHPLKPQQTLSAMGAIVALGIAFGDIGTSPLYVMNAFLHFNAAITRESILGMVSCIIWTLTLQTTVKYVWLMLRADNNGEGGILALFALQRRVDKLHKTTERRYLPALFAVIGAGALTADGIITPAITVTSAIEGLQLYWHQIEVVPIVLVILGALFLVQQFGTQTIGRCYGPVMLIWFLMLGILGSVQIIHQPAILAAFNPLHAVRLLTETPHGFFLLGIVFLCVTGAEALYSDLGHCGAANIRVSWGLVKTTLILNYLGQGAWLLAQSDFINYPGNPFFRIMPTWFLLPGIILATAAAIIASQSLISGLFTLFKEGMSMHLLPHMRIMHPTQIKGQIYVPFVNWFLCAACMAMVCILQSSMHMEDAYGLAITITMLMTSLLMIMYLQHRRTLYAVLFAVVFLPIETAFLVANLAKFTHGGVLIVLIGGVIAAVMTIWCRGEQIKAQFAEHLNFDTNKECREIIVALKNDTSMAMDANNLVFLTKSKHPSELEQKIFASIIYRRPKRANYYWTIHIHYTDEPDTLTYSFQEVIPDTLFRVNFHLGFQVPLAISEYFQEVLDDLEAAHEINLASVYPSLRQHQVRGDLRFIVVQRVYQTLPTYSWQDRLVMSLYENIRRWKISEVEAFGLNTSNVAIETAPLTLTQNHLRHPERVISQRN